MAIATITTDLRKQLLEGIQTDLVTGDENYYVGLSRSDIVTSSSTGTLRDQLDVRHQMQSIKSISNSSFVATTKLWTTNTVYNAWDDDNIDLDEFYVLNTDREVFVCIETPFSDTVPDESVNIPTSADAFAAAGNAGDDTKLGVTFQTADGYKWRYLYKMSNSDYSTYKSTDYMPVRVVTAFSADTPDEQEQLSLQNDAVDGEIIGISLVSGGTGYTGGVPDLAIEGNGSGAEFIALMDGAGTTVIGAKVNLDGNIYKHGTGYDFAKVTPSYGDAVFRPIIAPRNGLGSNPIRTLFANSLMLQIDFQNNEGATILTDNDFRSVALISGVTDYGTNDATSVVSTNALDKLSLSAVQNGPFVEDDLIKNTTDTAYAKVFSFDGSNLYYFQNDSTGFGVFSSGMTLVSTISGTQASIDGTTPPLIDRYSGDMLYINNITEIARSATQTEDIRIVIKLD